METLASTPANADNTAQVDAPEADAEGAETKGDGTAPSAPEASTPAPKRDPVQERIDKITREKYDGYRERDRYAYENEALKAELAKLKTAPTPQVAPANGFPTLEQFGYDEAKYTTAIAAHFERIAEQKGEAAAQRALEKYQQEQSNNAASQTWAQREAEFRKLKPDFDEKVKREPADGGPAITKHMADVIRESEIGPQIAYYLAEHAEQSHSIAMLPPVLQSLELGRIVERLTRPAPTPAVTQAPPPPPKVDSDAPTEKSPNEMTDKEFASWRRKQIAQRR